MAGTRGQPATLSARELVARLEPLWDVTEPAALAFDADGTLWSGDVGEDVFQYFTTRALLREDAAAALAREAGAHGIDASGSANDVAQRLFRAYLAGAYPERDVCAMMSWCYAGFSLEELGVHVESALSDVRLGERLHRELEPLLEFARSRRVRTVVVSASPTPVVEQAARFWAIAAEDVVACRAAVDGGCVAARLAAPVPYADEKPRALAAIAGDRALLASFGDNVFDIELLRVARLAVAVRPKPALRARLADVPGIVILAPFGG